MSELLAIKFSSLWNFKIQIQKGIWIRGVIYRFPIKGKISFTGITFGKVKNLTASELAEPKEPFTFA